MINNNLLYDFSSQLNRFLKKSNFKTTFNLSLENEPRISYEAKYTKNIIIDGKKIGYNEFPHLEYKNNKFDELIICFHIKVLTTDDLEILTEYNQLNLSINAEYEFSKGRKRNKVILKSSIQNTTENTLIIEEKNNQMTQENTSSNETLSIYFDLYLTEFTEFKTEKETIFSTSDNKDPMNRVIIHKNSFNYFIKNILKKVEQAHFFLDLKPKNIITKDKTRK